MLCFCNRERAFVRPPPPRPCRLRIASEASVVAMDKVALWPKGNCSPLIAGFLAWALISPGVAAAAFSYAADGGVVSADVGDCATHGADESAGISRGGIILVLLIAFCRSGQLDGPAGFLSVPPKGAELSFRAAAIVPIDARPIGRSIIAGGLDQFVVVARPTDRLIARYILASRLHGSFSRSGHFFGPLNGRENSGHRRRTR